MASEQSKVNQGPRTPYGAHVRGITNTLSGARGCLPINGFFGLFASSAALTGGPLVSGGKVWSGRRSPSGFGPRSSAGGR
jgi:hypothetical protein